jgi:hypothetical protein
MSAGKNYLKISAFQNSGGIPAYVSVYRNEDASQMSLNPGDISGGNFVMLLEVLRDSGGHFILCPADPASITGLSALLQ